MLDACFQVLVATDPFPSKTYLPVGIERIRVRRRPAGAMYAWARLDRRSDSGASGSIFLCDESGAVAVEIEGFEVKALDGIESAKSDEQLDRSLYEVRWTPSPRQIGEAAAGGKWLLLADSDGITSKLASILEDSDCLVEVVGSDTPESVIPLLSESTGIVVFGDEGCLGVMRLVQAIAQSGASPKLWIVTRGAQPVSGGADVSPERAPVWGLGRVIGHQEHIGIWGGMIDLDPSAPGNEAEQIAQELLYPSDEDQIAFRGGERYVARLERCRDLAPALPVRFRADASYLITGGFGALGLLTARWMVERGARRIILMSRTSLPERSLWNSQEISARSREANRGSARTGITRRDGCCRGGRRR